jgi:hypothetical protein
MVLDLPIKIIKKSFRKDQQARGWQGWLRSQPMSELTLAGTGNFVTSTSF